MPHNNGEQIVEMSCNGFHITYDVNLHMMTHDKKTDNQWEFLYLQIGGRCAVCTLEGMSLSGVNIK